MSGQWRRWLTDLRRNRVKGIPCTCGHDDLIHLGLTGRCLAPGGEAGPWADECKGFHRQDAASVSDDGVHFGDYR